MSYPSEQLVASLDTLSLHAFEAFCEDIAAMFGNTAECTQDSAGHGALSDLKRQFKKLAAVNQVQTQGVMDGTFQILLDQAGLFVLAGVFVMLPEKRVLETIRSGTLKDADYINDAIKEVGNLLVGSWDRVFREELKGHKHFKQADTFVGSIWDDPESHIGLHAEQDCRYVICRMKVDEFPEFKCAAVFPETLFETRSAGKSPEESTAQEKPAPTAETEPDSQTPESAFTVAGDKSAPPAAEVTPSVIEEASADTPAPITEAPPVMESERDEPMPGPVSEAIAHLTRQEPMQAESEPALTGVKLPSLTAAAIMNPAVLWLEPEQTVEEALSQMQRHNIGYILIGRDGHLEGLVSRSDIAAAISPYLRPVFAHWRRPVDDATLKIRIQWFMSRTVHTISPDAPLEKIMQTMMQHAVRGLPVMDADGQILGLVTVYEVFAALLNRSGLCLTGRPHQAPPGVR